MTLARFLDLACVSWEFQRVFFFFFLFSCQVGFGCAAPYHSFFIVIGSRDPREELGFFLVGCCSILLILLLFAVFVSERHQGAGRSAGRPLDQPAAPDQLIQSRAPALDSAAFSAALSDKFLTIEIAPSSRTP